MQQVNSSGPGALFNGKISVSVVCFVVTGLIFNLESIFIFFSRTLSISSVFYTYCQELHVLFPCDSPNVEVPFVKRCLGDQPVNRPFCPVSGC